MPGHRWSKSGWLGLFFEPAPSVGFLSLLRVDRLVLIGLLFITELWPETMELSSSWSNLCYSGPYSSYSVWIAA